MGRRGATAAVTRRAGPAAWFRGTAASMRMPVPRLWQAFVLGWLLVLILSAGWVTQEHLALSRRILALAALVGLAALYLWLTLRGALTDADLTPDGPGAAAVRGRLLVLAAMTLLVLSLILLVPEDEGWWLLMHVVVAAGLALPPRPAAAIIAALVGLALLCGWLVAHRLDALLLIQVAFGAGAIAIRQLTIAVNQLRTAREELAQLAVAEERLRFARDLHDLLGHSLSVIVLKSELAGRLLPSAPDRAATEVGDIERAAREALRRVREAVAGYRQPALLGELAAARELLAAAGIAATIEQRTGPLPALLDGLLAWTVREGVTNVIRHSRAHRCTIVIDRSGDMVRAEITDDGAGSGGGSPAHGSGLTGLAERAAAQGARLQAGPRPEGGFRLLLETPITRHDGAAP